MRAGEALKQLSRLLTLLGVLAILVGPGVVGERAAEAAAKVKAPAKVKVKAKTQGKEFQRRSMAARKGWAMRRMKQKATASLESKMQSDPGLAASPEKQASFFNRSMAAQKGWEARRASAGMAKTPKAAKTTKAKTTASKSRSKTTKKSSKKKASRKKQARKQDRKKKNDQALAAAAAPEAATDAPAEVDADPQQDEVAPEAMEATGPSRRSKILRRIGVGVAIIGGAALGVAGGWALFPVIGGLTALGGVPGTAIVGAVVGGGLSAGVSSWFLIDKPARDAQQAAGGFSDQGADKLRRWATRRQLENAGLNGAGVGGGLGGLNGPGMSLPGQLGNFGNN
ncbi:MAG TPA: hypothetical protein VFU21_01570 [Kofleriaceae bacterium]|nr:hypothetical protein [Kofleriaceae bacterium]